MPQHPSGRPRTQHVDIVDAVRPGNHRLDHRHRLHRGVPSTRTRQSDQRPSGVEHAEPLRGRGGQDQPGVPNRTVIIEDHTDRIEALAGFHSEGALSLATAGGVENRHRRNRKGTFRGYAPTVTSPDRWIQAEKAEGFPITMACTVAVASRQALGDGRKREAGADRRRSGRVSGRVDGVGVRVFLRCRRAWPI
jgi:hypothetical protein